MKRIAPWIQGLLAAHIHKLVARHHRLLTALSLLLTLGAVVVIATSWNINSDFRALLPEASETAQAMDAADARLGGGSSLFVVIDSPDMDANLKFAGDYAAKLRATPGVALAHYHNDKTFFEAHQLLYMEAADLEKLHDRLRDQLREEKKRANPLFVSLGKPKSREGASLDASDLQEKYKGKLIHEEYKEYLTSDDGFAVIVLVRFVESSTNIVATNKLIDAVRAQAASLDATSYHPKMTVEFGGGLANRQAQYGSILNDVRSSALFTMLGMFALIALYFGRARAVIVILGPLVMSVAWTLAAAFLLFGELTTITVFIFAIMLGLGIDFGIHLLSGYDHARLDGHDPVEALVRCFKSTGRATTLGGLTTFATFVVLSFAQFKGLSQFGMVASIGVLASLLAMLVVLPSLVLTLHHIWPHIPRAARVRKRTRAGAQGVYRIVRAALPIALLLTTFGTGLAIWQLPNLRFEEEFRRFGEIDWPWQDDSQPAPPSPEVRAAEGLAKHVALHAEQARASMDRVTYIASRQQKTLGQKYSNAVQNRQTSMPTILLFDDPVETERVHRKLQAALRDGELSTARTVNAIYAFMPGTAREQEERMTQIRRINALINAEPRAFLKAKDRERLDRLRELTDIQPFTIYDLPDWTKRLFREAGPEAAPAHEGEPFSFERTIYLTEAVDQLNGPEARRYMQQVRQSSGYDERPTFQIASQAYIYVAMLEEIRREGPIMMGAALICVMLILLIGLRSPARAIMAMIPLGFGVVWMLGLCAWLGIKLNFFNVIIIPAIIGIGVDDGVHFYLHYLERGRGSLASTLREVGGAITMTTLTSMLGFGGLAMTHYAGLKSMGHVAIVGLITCWTATLLVMPAALWVAERFSLDTLSPKRP